MPITVNKLTIPPGEPPWAFHQAFPSLEDRINRSPNGELPQKIGMPTKSSQPIVPQTPKLEALRPWEKSSLKSRDFTFRHITIKPKPLQHFAGEESELKPQRKIGRRRGPLAPEKTEHARKLRACWSCRLQKVIVI